MGTPTGKLQLDRANPQPGQWRFILLVNYYSSGNEIRLPFTAQIGFDTARVSVPGLPNDPNIKLSASGPPLTVPITITNTGGIAEAYFADARLQGLTSLTFGTFVATSVCGSFTELPYVCFGTYLPTQVHSVTFVAKATAPINIDVENFVGYVVGVTGAPDLYARTVGPDTVAASLTEPEVPWGEWILIPSLVGPFGPAGAPTTPVATRPCSQLKPFDASVSRQRRPVVGGDVRHHHVTIRSCWDRATGTIHVTITPNPAQVGTTVRGFIYIDTFNATVQTGDEVVRIPYSYTVAL